MTTRKLTYHTDSGHGWIEVSRADIDTLGIADQISPYSYQKGKAAYLEEDCDAALYMEAAKAAGWTLNMAEKYIDGDSPIRDYSRFSAKVPA